MRDGRGRCGSWDDGDDEGDSGDHEDGSEGGESGDEDAESSSTHPPSAAASTSASASLSSSFSSSSVATAVIVVRYFGGRHLGVTSGRLRDLYARTARLALHRHANGMDGPFVERYRQRDGIGGIHSTGPNATADNIDDSKRGARWINANLYGLGAGDCELILDVVKSPPPILIPSAHSHPNVDDSAGDDGEENIIVRNLLRELKFEKMVGPENAPLPRLQNLQADMLYPATTVEHSTTMIVPVYRYPGNYTGLEYPTHPWSYTSLYVKRAVESALRPLYVQVMNHCVTNLYRDGRDDIQHHSDKDLDLNRRGVIVSVSFGSSRVMEVRDRSYPHDVVRVDLPPGSMLVLGPYTNARFTHAVLPLSSNDRPTAMTGDDVTCNVEEGGRISLTFRDVRTFLDTKTQRLFGQGAATATISLPPFSGPSVMDTNEDGSIREGSLTAIVERLRNEDGRDRRSAIAIALVIGVGYVSSKFCNEGGAYVSREYGLLALLQDASAAAITGSASYWYIRRRRREMRLQCEEDGARAFFSKKSASGNKY
ncbi:hypothetical protein ACHAXA_008056 [Cyclostephanos tholiformis]|uniref:Fe2OG dioxygenase domain-containing protein n=1 Tax=Cyclostephanos tholiformis TaxID=382380 RepID=A0ABD3SEE4_9STRA